MNKTDSYRFKKTTSFVSKYITTNEVILDLGSPNPLSNLLKENNFKIDSAYNFDFDIEPNKVNNYSYEVLTAFEVIEHLVSPYPILKVTKAKKLFVTVPLNLWFAKAHRNFQDPHGHHYHEFESWQLDMLLEKAGWEIKAREKWIPPFQLNGFRSILRAFTPRFYAVYAERK